MSNYAANKKAKRRAVIRSIAKDRSVSLAVAAHIYLNWPLKKRQEAGAKITIEKGAE